MQGAGPTSPSPELGSLPERSAPSRLVVRFMGAAALAGLAVTLPLAWLLDPAGAFAALGLYGLVIAVASWFLFRTYPHRRLGFANLVTLFRASLICALVAPLAHWGFLLTNPAGAWIVVAIAGFALCLDGVDGYLARREGVVSRFGASFDVEIDSILALSLAILLLQGGKAGWWVLALGVLRYLFVIAGYVLPWLRADLPERFSRKLICVIQIGALVVLASPLIAPSASAIIAALVSAMLVWSFAVDIIWLAGKRK